MSKPSTTGSVPEELRRTLGVPDAVMIGLGSMIGAGIFAALAPAARGRLRAADRPGPGGRGCLSAIGRAFRLLMAIADADHARKGWPASVSRAGEDSR